MTKMTEAAFVNCFLCTAVSTCLQINATCLEIWMQTAEHKGADANCEKQTQDNFQADKVYIHSLCHVGKVNRHAKGVSSTCK